MSDFEKRLQKIILEINNFKRSVNNYCDRIENQIIKLKNEYESIEECGIPYKVDTEALTKKILDSLKTGNFNKNSKKENVVNIQLN